MNHHNGYTLIEALLTVAFMSALFGISTPLSRSFMARGNLDIAVTTFAQNMRRAEVLARGGKGDAPWGVHATSGVMTIFQGQSYAERNVNEDEVYTIPDAVSITGVTEYVFAKITGYPNTVGTTTFSSLDSNEKTVTTNEKGTVSY